MAITVTYVTAVFSAITGNTGTKIYLPVTVKSLNNNHWDRYTVLYETLCSSHHLLLLVSKINLMNPRKDIPVAL